MTGFPHPIVILYPSNIDSFSSFIASSASWRHLKLTNPQFFLRILSSSERGHIILMLLTGPNLLNISCSLSSVTDGARLPTYRFVVVGSPVSNEPSSGLLVDFISSKKLLMDFFESKSRLLDLMRPPEGLGVRVEPPPRCDLSRSRSFISSKSLAISFPPLRLPAGLSGAYDEFVLDSLYKSPVLPPYTSPLSFIRPPRTNVFPPSSPANDATNSSYIFAASASSCRFFSSLSSRAF
mmetsp:Transcript_4775/g.7259  ORF Transcript_4775/g.7259 Transcript_4775/m.7259 type:complete len:237 (+) Transcript_4775:2290-3000(+)